MLTVRMSEPRSRMGLFVAAATLAHIPLLYVHFTRMWTTPEGQFFPFVLFAVVGLIYTRWNSATQQDAREAGWSRAAFFCCLSFAFLVLAVLLYNPSAATVSFILTCAGVVSVLAIYRHPTNLWGIWALLWLLIPLPFGTGEALTQSLQRMSSIISSELLDLLRINHAMHGNTLMLPGKQLFVDEACSGIVSVMSVIACAAIYAVWKNRSLLHTLLLIGTGIFWATLMNVVRISTIAFAEAEWQYDLSTGTPHEILGLVVFLTTFLAVASTDQLFDWFLQPVQVSPIWQRGILKNPLTEAWNGFTGWINPSSQDKPSTRDSRPWSSLAPPRWLLYASLLFGLLATYQFGGVILAATSVSHRVADLDKMPETIIPKRVGSWQQQSYQHEKRDSYDPNWGAASHIFEYTHAENERLRLKFSVDYPFDTQWHELTGCYSSVGWLKTGRQVISPASNDTQPWNYVTGQFENAGRFGYLAYTFVDANGDVLSPPASAFVERFMERLKRSGPNTVKPRLFQIQVWCESAAPISQRTAADVQQALLEFRKHVHDYIRQQAKADTTSL